MFVKYYLSIFALVLLCIGCNKKDKNACLTFPAAPVLGVEGVSSGNTNQDIPFTVTFAIVNGCGSFSKMEESATGNTIIITVIAKYEGCMCTEIYSEQKRDYIFKRTVPGNYQLKFNKGDNTYFVKDITIQ